MFTYLTDCPERRRIDVGSPTEKDGCGVIAKAVGFDYGCHVKMCAECRLNGSIDHAYLNTFILQMKTIQLRDARLGFYKNVVDIDTILISLWPLLKNNVAQKAWFADMIVELVRLNRITGEHAEQLISKEFQELVHELNATPPESGTTKTGTASPGTTANP